jgi:hypothetical protein
MCSLYNVVMNITFSFDDALLTAAKVMAARQNTSVNALVRQALEHVVATDGAVAMSGSSGVAQALVDYSMGRKPRLATMQELAIDDYGVLIRLLNEAGLPHPMVPLAQREAMAVQLAEVLKAAGGES